MRTKVEKIRSLATRPGTESEGEAARAALERIRRKEPARERIRLSDRIVTALPVPAAGYRIHYDAPKSNGSGYVPGFGVLVTAKGHRSFVLRYRTLDGREGRCNIGSLSAWNVESARVEAAEILRRIKSRPADGISSYDPVREDAERRGAATMNDLCDRFEREHLPEKRKATRDEYRSIITHYVRPELGSTKVAAITRDDVRQLHRKITTGEITKGAKGKRRGPAPYRANRTLSVLSKMLNLAIFDWEMRSEASGNPVKGIERNPEEERERYLSKEELNRLAEALDKHDDRQACDIVRLLLLTGARVSEVMKMKWDDIDWGRNEWIKLTAHTKQKKRARFPLSTVAVSLLRRLHDKAKAGAKKQRTEVPPYVFPGRGTPHRTDIKRAGNKILKAAGLDGVRRHDLRHSFASVLASGGASLPMIGRLLGHTQPKTTARYVHLFDEPVRAATERASATMGGK